MKKFILILVVVVLVALLVVSSVSAKSCNKHGKKHCPPPTPTAIETVTGIIIPTYTPAPFWCLSVNCGPEKK